MKQLHEACATFDKAACQQAVFCERRFARFDPESNSWEDLPPLPEGRSSLDAAVVGDTLYVVGGPGVTKIHLAPGLANGTVVDILDVPGALSPTTADARGSRLYVVDAKFPLLPDPTTPFSVTSIPR